jgi:hypothetical protein
VEPKALLRAVQGGYQRTAEALLSPESTHSVYEFAICVAIHTGDLDMAKKKTELATVGLTKLMARAAESDIECYEFGAALGKTEHKWLCNFDCKVDQTLPANPTAERLVEAGNKLQGVFEQRLGVLFGAAVATNLRMGPVKKVDSLSRKMQAGTAAQMQEGTAAQMLDINRASFFTNCLDDFDFLSKLQAGEVAGFKVCRAKVGEGDNKWPSDHKSLSIPPNLFLNLEMTPITGTSVNGRKVHDVHVSIYVFVLF